MEQRFLIDTNILVYQSKDFFPPEINRDFINQLFIESFNISIITKLEFLGWRRHTDESFRTAEEFLTNAEVYNIDDKIVRNVISLRREINIKLPDAIIAATCLVYDFILITGNQKDFKDISNLRMFNE